MRIKIDRQGNADNEEQLAIGALAMLAITISIIGVAAWLVMSWLT
jgi:hypothetical protein